MSGKSVVVVDSRGRRETEQLAGLFRANGMGRSEFCRSHGMSLSTLNRHLKKQQSQQKHAGDDGVGRSRLVVVELAATVAPVATVEQPRSLTVLLSNGRRVEVGRSSDREALAQLVTMLERM